MLYKTYEFVCRLPAHEVLERIKALLSKEWVEYKAADLSVTSTQTPIVFVNFDPRLHSRNNWVGINPFVCVSGIAVRCESCNNELTRVTVRVNRFRTFFFMAYWVFLLSMAALSMTEPNGAIFFVVSVCMAWVVLVSFFGGYLINKEIGDSLTKSATERRQTELPVIR